MATDDLRREIAGERAQLSDAVTTLRSELGTVAGRGKKAGAAMGAAMGVATALRLALRFRRR
jgi:hypothetical protein